MRTISRIAAVVLASSVLLAACGDGDSSTEIDVTGSFGEKPTIEAPTGEPSTELDIEVLSEGDGPEVAQGDYIVAHYLGQTWEQRDGEDYIFDNSYDSGQAAGFSLDGVITGWKEGLAGQQVGSRVLLSIPPEMAYGEAEQTEGTEEEGDAAADGQANSEPTEGPTGEPTDQATGANDLAGETLLFVVDIVASVPMDAAASGEPVGDLPADLPVVNGGETGAPSVDFADTTAPEQSDTTILVQGDGPALGENIVAHLLEAAYPNGEPSSNTWDLPPPSGGPQHRLSVAALESLPGWTDIADDVTVGSRIMTRLTAEDATTGNSQSGDDGGQTEEASPVVLIVDILATY